MPIYQLNKNDHWFPEPDDFEEGDIVAVGGDLNEARILAGYCQGIFPWYNQPGDYVWYCPQERSVLFLQDLRVSHSMRNEINKKRYRCTMDLAFGEVIQGCRSGIREGATWIHDEIIKAYLKLHHTGFCHSIEVWEEDKLVGGLYGSSIGHLFFGESMFSTAPNSSKFAFIFLAQKLKELGWKAIDCQVPTSHLQSLGATTILRAEFLTLLEQELLYPTLRGNWGKMTCFANNG